MVCARLCAFPGVSGLPCFYKGDCNFYETEADFRDRTLYVLPGAVSACTGRAGPLPRAWACCSRTRRTRACAPGWGPLCEHAEEGLPLAECMRRTGAFPAYMTDMIALAEQTGRLQDVLPALSAHYARQDRMASDIRHAVAVPVALFCVMLAVVFLLITQVLPVFDRVFAQLGVRMSPMAVRLMQVGDVLSGAGLGIAIALCALAVVALAVALIPALRGRFTAFVRFHLGGRGIFGRVAATRFASAMAMATASGLMMDEAAELAGKLCGGAKQIDERRACARKKSRRAAVPPRRWPTAAYFRRGMAGCCSLPSVQAHWQRRWTASPPGWSRIRCAVSMRASAPSSPPLSS